MEKCCTGGNPCFNDNPLSLAFAMLGYLYIVFISLVPLYYIIGNIYVPQLIWFGNYPISIAIGAYINSVYLSSLKKKQKNMVIIQMTASVISFIASLLSMVMIFHYMIYQPPGELYWGTYKFPFNVQQPFVINSRSFVNVTSTPNIDHTPYGFLTFNSIVASFNLFISVMSIGFSGKYLVTTSTTGDKDEVNILTFSGNESKIRLAITYFATIFVFVYLIYSSILLYINWGEAFYLLTLIENPNSWLLMMITMAIYLPEGNNTDESIDKKDKSIDQKDNNKPGKNTGVEAARRKKSGGKWDCCRSTANYQLIHWSIGFVMSIIISIIYVMFISAWKQRNKLGVIGQCNQDQMKARLNGAFPLYYSLFTANCDGVPFSQLSQCAQQQLTIVSTSGFILGGVVETCSIEIIDLLLICFSLIIFILFVVLYCRKKRNKLH